jgi:hypothetical protein
MKPRVQRPPFSDSEMCVIDAIVHRALIFLPDREWRDAKMDLIACHLTCPLELDMMLDADDSNFIHDICGIERHLDRRTFELKDSFIPRFAKAFHSGRKESS